MTTERRAVQSLPSYQESRPGDRQEAAEVSPGQHAGLLMGVSRATCPARNRVLTTPTQASLGQRPVDVH